MARLSVSRCDSEQAARRSRGRGVDRRVLCTQHSAAGLAAGGRGPNLGKGRGLFLGSWGLRSGGVSCSGNPLAAGILQLGTEWRDCTPR